MTDREAQEIIRMVESNWSFDLGQARQLWRDGLVRYPADVGTQAVIHLARHSKFKPTLSELLEVTNMFARGTESPVGEQRAELPAVATERLARGTPEWVWVWTWARWRRDPREERGFPQQLGHVDPTSMLSMEEYRDLLAEWKDAGSPKEKSPLPIVYR